MSFLDWLRDGSEFHKASFISPIQFQISVTDADSEECKERFHEIVGKAFAQANNEGYEVLNPHRSSMDSKGRWDTAIIKILEP